MHWLGYEDTDKKLSWIPADEVYASEAISDFHSLYSDKPGLFDSLWLVFHTTCSSISFFSVYSLSHLRSLIYLSLLSHSSALFMFLFYFTLFWIQTLNLVYSNTKITTSNFCKKKCFVRGGGSFHSTILTFFSCSAFFSFPFPLSSTLFSSLGLLSTPAFFYSVSFLSSDNLINIRKSA